MVKKLVLLGGLGSGEKTYQSLIKAGDNLVERGLARRLPGGAIQSIGCVDLEKLAKFQRSYAEAFEQRMAERRQKELEGWERLRDFVFTY